MGEDFCQPPSPFGVCSLLLSHCRSEQLQSGHAGEATGAAGCVGRMVRVALGRVSAIRILLIEWHSVARVGKPVPFSPLGFVASCLGH